MKWFVVLTLFHDGWFYDTTKTIKGEMPSYAACMEDVAESGKLVGQLSQAGWTDVKIECVQKKSIRTENAQTITN